MFPCLCFHSDYKEYHTDTTVRFVVNMTTAKMEEAVSVGLYKKFKLESSISIANMVGGCVGGERRATVVTGSE